jgi:hypothetical protein
LLTAQLPHQQAQGLQNLWVGELESCPSGPRDIDEQTAEIRSHKKHHERTEHLHKHHVRMPIKIHHDYATYLCNMELSISERQ